MEVKPLMMLLIAMSCLLGGFVYSYFTPSPNFFAEIPFTGVTIAAFLAGTIFFGYLAFIPMLLFGFQLGADKNAAIFLYFIPSLIATYAGTKLGFALQADFFKKRNAMKDMKIIILLLIGAVALALVVEMSLPMIINFWPKEYFGLSVVEGKNNAIGLIGEISKLAKR
ncbi:Uncharacterised protein [uncultured archaeon]|nr:Uncharacterised protein [uncultured archaeon]